MALSPDELLLVEKQILEVWTEKKAGKQALSRQFRSSGVSGSTTMTAIVTCAASYHKVDTSASVLQHHSPAPLTGLLLPFAYRAAVAAGAWRV